MAYIYLGNIKTDLNKCKEKKHLGKGDTEFGVLHYMEQGQLQPGLTYIYIYVHFF